MNFQLLPEGISTESIVDEPEFTEVTNNGEVYTLYRIVRITHESLDPTDKWTHLANVFRVRVPAIGVARLRIVNKVVEDAAVIISGDLI